MPMVKGAPIYGTYGGRYEDDGEGGSTWVAEGPGQWVQDDNDVSWVGDKYIIGYEPDVFVPDTTPDTTPGYGGFFGGSIEEGVKSGLFTPVASTPVASTPVASTPAAPATTSYTPPDLGLDIPPGNIGGDGVPPVGPPGNLGLGIPAAPTYYEEFVPPQQPVVPQLTQAELLQQIVKDGESSDDDGAPGFQHGGLATPVQEPITNLYLPDAEESKAGIEALKDRIRGQTRSPLSSGIGSQGDRLKSMYVNSPRDPGGDPRSVSDIVEKQGQQTYMYGYEGDPDTLLTLPQGTSVEGNKGMFITEGSIAGVPWLAEEARAQGLNPDLVDTVVRGPSLDWFADTESGFTNEERAGTYIHENAHKLLNTAGLRRGSWRGRHNPEADDLGVALKVFGLTRQDYGPDPEEFIVAAMAEATGNPKESYYLSDNKLDSASEQLKKPGVLETLSLVENLIYRQQGGQRKESHLRDLEELEERVNLGPLSEFDRKRWDTSVFKSLLDETYELGSGT